MLSQIKLNTFFSTFNLILCLVGYQLTTTLFSSFIPEFEASRSVTVPYRAFSLLICLITIFLNFKSKFKLNVVIKILLIFWLLLLIRFFYDMYFRTDVYVFADKKLQIILYMIPMTLIPMYSVMKSYKSIDFNKLLFWTYILFAISICMTYFSNVSFQEEESMDRLNANNALNTINAGHFGLTALLLSLYFLTSKKLVMIKKMGVCLIGIIALLIMFRAGSRGPILSLIGVVGVWILGASKKKTLNITILLFFCLLGYIFIDYIFQFIGYISPMLEARLNSGNVEDQLYGRDNLLTTAFNCFLENPILGKNFAIYWGDGTMIYAHNVFFDSIMQLGIIGGVMIIYILWKSVVKIIKLINIRSPYFWIGLILMQNIMGVMVSGAIYESPLISILIVLLFMPLDRDNYSLQKLKS